MKTPLWQPSNQQIQSSAMYQFIQYVNDNYNLSITNYHELHEWSIINIEDFWECVVNFTDIIFQSKQPKVLEINEDVLQNEWFPGASLNFAENLLRKNDSSIAIITYNERQEKSTLTYAELNQQVVGFATALTSNGIQKGDRVVGFISNIKEVVVAMLGTASIGAIWSSCSPDFGIEAVVSRFSQIQPKLLITSMGYYYNGKSIPLDQKINALAKALPSIHQIVLAPYGESSKHLNVDCPACSFAEFLQPTTKVSFTPCSFDSPLFILYSSGTTGKPKAIVHGVGGTILQHSKELILHTNVKPHDVVFYFTTTGWMMWNWLISSLKTGAAVVLYDGSPIYPRIDSLFDMIDVLKITIFGVSAKYLGLLEKKGKSPLKTHSLSSLHTILSTGSPLADHSFYYVYADIKEDVCLFSISGGSDIISCFGLGNPIQPVYPAQIQSIGLGMDMRIFNQEGTSIHNQLGELVCTKPFPSRPIYFWNDHNNEKYRKSYYAKYPNVWTHGDFAKITDNGGLIITGRSDTTLNPGGIRIGTAEIYQQLEKLPEITDSLIIGQQENDDIIIILFVILKQDNLTNTLIQHIKETIRNSTSIRHVPKLIYQVTDIPRTINDKKVESIISNIFNRRTLTNIDALANPKSLDEYRDIFKNKSSPHE